MNMSDIQIAKSLLNFKGAVLVIVKNGKVLFTSSKNGIQPFFDALSEYPRNTFSGCSIADRVTGKAALMLAVYLGAKNIYTPLASEHAQNAALKLKFNLIFEKSTAFIKNRTQDGMCPMEKTVLAIDEPEEAYLALKNKLKN